MSDTTVVVPGDDDAGNTASFEAGVAAATSVQAKTEAEEAALAAESAQATAADAGQTATAAAGAAYAAEAEIGSLRGEFAAFMDEMRAALTAPPAVVEEEPEVPAPEPEPEKQPEDQGEKKPKKQRRYGSSLLFGSAAYED